MLRVTLRGLRAHRLRFVATALAVLLGVAFVVGTFVLTDTIRAAFGSLFADANRGTDVVVRAHSSFTGGLIGERPRVDGAVLDRVAAVPGVAATAGRVRGYAQILGDRGEPLGTGDAPTAGEAWVDAPGLNPYRLVEGAPPQAADDVVLDRGSKIQGDLAVGDSVRIVVRAGQRTYRISGFVTIGGEDRALGATAALFRPDVAQQLLAEPGRYDSVAVEAAPGVGADELRERIRDVLDDPNLEAVTGAELTAENRADTAERLQFFTASLLLFSGVSLFVATFIIYNTFSVVVTQRTRELGLLRAIGATRRQVLGSVLVEAAVIGVVASLVGVVAGLGVASALKALLAGLDFRLPTIANVVEARTIVVALIVGVAVTTVSAAVPGRRAATITPMAALRDQDVSGPTGTAVRGIAGAAGLVAAALLVTAGAVRGGDGLRILSLGAIVGFLALVVAGPAVTAPVCRVLGRPLTRFRGVPGALARENAMRNPRRTSATASALMIGVGLVAFVTVFAASVRAAVTSTLETSITADLAIRGTGFRGVLTSDVARRAAEVPGVAVASGITVTRVLIDGRPDGIVGIDPGAFTMLADVGVREGSLADLGDRTVAVARSWADQHGLRLGDTLPITFPRTGELPMRVVAIYDRANVVGTHLLSVATMRANVTNPFDVAVLVKSDGDLQRTRLALQDALRDDPTVQVLDRQDLIGDRTEEVDQLVGLVYALLFLAVLIALLGIVNTLALSVLERTREIGLLRAVGMTRAQVRTAVRWEAVLIALLGTVLGLAADTALGVVTVRALADEGLDRLAVPAGPLVALAIGGALFGVIGAVLPARRASRLDVLSAIAVE